MQGFTLGLDLKLRGKREQQTRILLQISPIYDNSNQQPAGLDYIHKSIIDIDLQLQALTNKSKIKKAVVKALNDIAKSQAIINENIKLINAIRIFDVAMKSAREEYIMNTQSCFVKNGTIHYEHSILFCQKWYIREILPVVQHTIQCQYHHYYHHYSLKLHQLPLPAPT